MFLSLSLSLYLSLSLSFALSRSFSLALSLSHAFSPFRSRSLSLPPSLFFSLSLSAPLRRLTGVACVRQASGMIKPSLRGGGGILEGVQRYFAHKKTPVLLGPLQDPRHRPTVGSSGGAFSFTCPSLTRKTGSCWGV